MRLWKNVGNCPQNTRKNVKKLLEKAWKNVGNTPQNTWKNVGFLSKIFGKMWKISYLCAIKLFYMRLLKRKIDNFLVEWKESPNKKPLIVRGARQIGKTESISAFGRAHYRHFININFVLQEKYKSIFAWHFSAHRTWWNLDFLWWNAGLPLMCNKSQGFCHWRTIWCDLFWFADGHQL